MAKLYGESVYQCGRYQAIGWEAKCHTKETWIPGAGLDHTWTPEDSNDNTWTPAPAETADYVPG